MAETQSTILNLLNEDNLMINYRPAFARMTGSVTAGILLQQMFYRWTRHGGEPFYKFKEPCLHEDYQADDSWCEELAFTRHEFDGAISAVGTKVTKGLKKADLMAYAWPTLPDDQTSDAYKKAWREAIRHIVIYWTDSNRKTWYWLNETLLEKAIEVTYSGKGAFRLYLEKDGKRLYLGNGGKRLYPEQAENAFTCLSETPSETPTKTPTESESPSTTESVESAHEAPAPVVGDDGDEILELILPEVRKLHLSQDAKRDLLEKGADYALAIAWECTARGVNSPGALAVSKMRGNGPADEMLDLAQAAIEIAAEIGVIDRDAADRALRNREITELNDQAQEIVASRESEEAAAAASAPAAAETHVPPEPDGLDGKPNPDGWMTWKDVWIAAQGNLSGQLNGATYQSYLARAKAVKYADGVLTIRTPNFTAMEILNLRYSAVVTEAVQKAAGAAVTVQFVTDQKIFRQWVDGELVELAGTTE